MRMVHLQNPDSAWARISLHELSTTALNSFTVKLNLSVRLDMKCQPLLTKYFTYHVYPSWASI